MTPRPHGLYYSFNRFLERHFPRDLYRRAMIILIVPIVLMQLIAAGIFLDRHWDQMTKVLGRALSNEIGMLLSLYEKSDKSPAAFTGIRTMARERLRIDMNILSPATLPGQGDIPFYALFDTKMQKYLARETGKPFWVDSNAPGNTVDIRVQTNPGIVIQFIAEEERSYAASTPGFLALMLLSSALLSTIAVIFLRNQVRPIIELARAAQSFGLGREVGNFSPRGAAEVRLAGQSFLDMKRRIARHVEQRTAMLAGVSHDLRTIITRFRLELALLGDNPKTRLLKEDVDEMQHMLEDYMNFVRGDGDEASDSINLPEAVARAVAKVNRDTNKIEIASLPTMAVQVKPNAFQRLLANILSNAARHGTLVRVSGEVRDDRLWIYVDDDGPGIPEDKREAVFRPFVRLDTGRNIDDAGTGLGLAIALDIAHAHGGDILLEDAPLGGLRVALKIPV